MSVPDRDDTSIAVTVPADLTERNQWILWRFVGADRRKMPFTCAGVTAKTNDPATWTTYECVAAKCNGTTQPGYVFAADDPYVGIDLDGCRNPQTGEIAKWARTILERLDSYSEVSPSGTGVKVWIRGSLRGKKGKKRELTEARVADKTPAVEMYDRGRYFAVTGERLDEYGDVIRERQSVVDELMATYWPELRAQRQPDRVSRQSNVLERARKYVAKMSPAISGHDGHGATFHVACTLVQGFALDEADALDILRGYSLRCDPPWSEAELHHKITSAMEQPGERGSLLRGTRPRDGQVCGTPERRPSQTTPTVVAPWQPFPVDVLPEPVRSFVISGAQAIGNDAAYIALPLLTVIASAIGNTRRIRLKHGWTEPPILWSGCVGESGTGKTPGYKLVMRPVRERQRKALERHALATQEYEQALLHYEKRLTEWKRSKQSEEGEPPEKPQPPKAERCVVSDTTVEALAPLLLDNPRGLLLARDELAGWINSFDRYAAKGKSGSDSAHWLSMHAAESIMVDRKTGQPRTIFVPHAAMCISGGIQPGILRRALGAEHRESGLAARLLLAYPPRRVKCWTEADIDEQTEAAIAKLLERLYEIPPVETEDGELRPVLIGMTAEAKREWVKFYDEHNEEQAELSGDLCAAWSKLEGYAARLALVIHFSRWAADDPTLTTLDKVDAATITAGITLSRWFGAEARRVYAMLSESDEDRDRRQLIELIDRKGGTVTIRELLRSSRQFKTADDARAAIDELAQVGRGRWHTDQPEGSERGRPVERFFLSADTVDVDTNHENPAKTRIVSTSTPSASPDGDGWGDV